MLMDSRMLLVTLIVASTAAFVVGVIVERSSADTHAEPPTTAEATGGAESSEDHAGEQAEGNEARTEATSGGTTEDEDETLLGVDLEATVCVASRRFLASARPGRLAATRLGPLLGVVAVAMGIFAALDVREVVHQIDEANRGLAVLAAVVAVLHLAAAAVALHTGRSTAVAGESLA